MEDEQRQQAIETIKALFSPDAEDQATATFGHCIINRARREVGNWRREPTEVLVRAAELCRETEEELRTMRAKGASWLPKSLRDF